MMMNTETFSRICKALVGWYWYKQVPYTCRHCELLGICQDKKTNGNAKKVVFLLAKNKKCVILFLQKAVYRRNRPL